MTVAYLLHVGAAVCFGCVVVGVPARVNLTALGLLLWCVAGLV